MPPPNSEFVDVAGGWRHSLAIRPSADCDAADMNCDGVVNVFDLLILLGNWG